MKLITDKSQWRDAIQKILVFRYLEDAELDDLLLSGDILEYDEDEPIINEGHFDQNVFGVLSGTVCVSVKENDGKDVFICALGEGEIFGEAGFFLKIKRTASVISKDKAIVFRLERKALMKHIRTFPTAGNKILLITIYGLLRKLRGANQELAYERKGDMNQTDIDDILDSLLT